MFFNNRLTIGQKTISNDSPTFIIAEAGVNHGGDISIAEKLVDIACEAGADAVKFQAFKTEKLILNNVKKAEYQTKTTDSCESQADMLKKLEVSKENNIRLMKRCSEKGIIFLTTPFDEYSLDELDDLELAAYKVASTDLTNIPFLIKIAKKKKPIFLSTGMSYLAEVELALEAINRHNRDVVLLQCTANYPIDDDEANLNVLNTYKKNFDILIGYSDHSVGLGAAAFAIPMGAKVVEKHFTYDKNSVGPDHKASLSPDELTEFVRLVRRVDKYMGSAVKSPSLSEQGTRRSLQKCFVAAAKISKGDVFTDENIVAKRTGGIGISPIYYFDVLGKTASANFEVDDIITL